MNGFLVTKGRIAPFIVTLGTMAIFRSLTSYIGKAGEFRSVTLRTETWDVSDTGHSSARMDSLPSRRSALFFS
jgi:ribose/xylose/arabinose/galactoside ABC-type transport system permease subunit